MPTDATKKPWGSATLWVNLIMAGLAFFPLAAPFADPVIIAAMFTAANTLLRFKTNSGISFK